MSRHAQQPEPTGADLVVLSHLRWAFVWQRPQHLMQDVLSASAAASPARSSTGVTA